MALHTHYTEWTIAGLGGASGTAFSVSEGGFSYTLTGSEPAFDRLEPVRCGPMELRPERSMARRYTRTEIAPYARLGPRPDPLQPWQRSPTLSPVPGMEDSLTRPQIGREARAALIRGQSCEPDTNRFGIGFVGAGMGPGFPFGGSVSTPLDRSEECPVFFAEASRTALDFVGPGVIIDVTGAVIRGVSLQFLLFNLSPDLLSGAERDELYRMLIERLGDTDTGDWVDILREFAPAVGLALGECTGAAGGITIFGGRFAGLTPR